MNAVVDSHRSASQSRAPRRESQRPLTSSAFSWLAGQAVTAAFQAQHMSRANTLKIGRPRAALGLDPLASWCHSLVRTSELSHFRRDPRHIFELLIRTKSAIRLEQECQLLPTKETVGGSLINAIDSLAPGIGYQSTPFALLGKELSVAGRHFMSWICATSWVSLPGRRALLCKNPLPGGSR